jgi:hypothetical protein
MQNSKLKTLIFTLWFYALCFRLCAFAEGEFVYDEKGKRNPFIPLVTSDGRLLKLDREEGVAGLAIEGIIYDKNGVSYAVVNGEVVKVGDKISDYQVLRIKQNKVIFIKEGEPLEVELKKEEESETPKN